MDDVGLERNVARDRVRLREENLLNGGEGVQDYAMRRRGTRGTGEIYGDDGSSHTHSTPPKIDV